MTVKALPAIDQVARLALKSTSLNVIVFADSHGEGQIPLATAIPGDVYGFFSNDTYGSVSRNKWWNGTADGAYIPGYTSINSVTTPNASNDQANSNTSVAGSGFSSFIPRILDNLRVGYPLSTGTLRFANFGVGGSSSYTWAAEPAQAYVGCPGVPADGDTIAIGFPGSQVTYRFKTTPAQINDVTIGTAQATLVNLMNAINGEGTGFFAGTGPHPNCFAPNTPQSNIYLKVYALTPGSAGNAMTVVSSNTAGITGLNQSFAGASPISFGLSSAGIGKDQSALYLNAKSKLGTLPAADRTIVLIALGTNDANRPGYRGRGTQAALTTLITNTKTDFPGAKIVMWRPPVPRAAPTSAAMSSTVLPAIDAIVAADPTNIFPVDMYSVGLGNVGSSTSNQDIVRSDGLHLTTLGYSIAASLFAAQIANICGFTR